MESETAGQRIRRALNAAGATQQQLARYVGVSDKSVGNWVADRDQPKGSHLAKISEMLGVKGSWILTGEQTVDAQEMLREMRQLKGTQEEILAALLELRRLVEAGSSE